MTEQLRDSVVSALAATNLGAERVSAGPPVVHKEILADQSFSNRGGYKRTVVSVTNDLTGKCDAQGAGEHTRGASHSELNLHGTSGPRSSIPRPGLGATSGQLFSSKASTQGEESTPGIDQDEKIRVKSGRTVSWQGSKESLATKPPSGSEKQIRNLDYAPSRPNNEAVSQTRVPSETVSSTAVRRDPDSNDSAGKGKKLTYLCYRTIY